MKHPIRRNPGLALSFASIVTLALALLPSAGAQAPTPGERWRTSMSMEMMGMKMPGMTQEVCSPKNADNTPPVGNEDCQTSNVRRSGNTLSFDMQCKDGMTGTMQMTQESPTKWSGKMLANTSEGQMTMNMRSEKLPGDCDASEMQRKMNQLVAKGNAQQAQACLDGARAGSAQLFIGPTAACKDKASVDAYCGNVKSMAGYNTIARQQRMTSMSGFSGPASFRTALADSGKLCGFAPETVRKQHCGTAQSKKAWTFFAEECPELSQPIAKRECAGRDFTNPVAPAWVDFCSAYAAAGRSAGARTTAGSATGVVDADGAGRSSGTAAAAEPTNDATTAGDEQKPADKAKEAMKKGKDALKGLFGR